MPMPSAETLRGLLEKVEAATGPDPSFDRLLCCELDISPWQPSDRGTTQFCMDGSKMAKATPKLTGSVDAARAAVDLRLEGWSQESGRSGFGNPAWCRLWNPTRAPGEGNTIRADHNGGSEPLAILAALLRAILAQSGEASRG